MAVEAVADVIHDIPVEALPAYRGRRVIVRSRSPAGVVMACRLVPDAEIVCVQLDQLPGDVDALAAWGAGIPVQLVMADPAVEFPTLYRYARLIDTHPIRVVMPARPGFSRAVKAATSLQMAVKLEVGQPAPHEIDELAAVLAFSLHERSCTQPVEFFHGVLRALYHGEATTLRSIQDEDPARIRHLDDDGAEWPSRPARLVEPGECAACEFRGICGGYFKWPRLDYACDGVKTLFRTLATAAGDLRRDVAAAIREADAS
jgi:hypothetical protein